MFLNLLYFLFCELCVNILLSDSYYLFPSHPLVDTLDATQCDLHKVSVNLLVTLLFSAILFNFSATFDTVNHVLFLEHYLPLVSMAQHYPGFPLTHPSAIPSHLEDFSSSACGRVLSQSSVLTLSFLLTVLTVSG